MLSLRIISLTFLCCLVSSLQPDRSVLGTTVTNSKPRIYYLHIKSDVRYRFATTSVTSKVVNFGRTSREALFDVTLPKEAFITNFTLLISEKEYIGEVKEKEEAKTQYEKAKKSGQSAGIIKSNPRETNKFQLQVNVAARQKVTFELRYQELLRRVKGVYNHVIFINPRETVDDFKVEVAIEDSRDITTLRVPPLRDHLLTEVDITATNSLAVIQRPTPKTAYILYRPSKAAQEAVSVEGISGQFVVEYDVDRQNDAGELLVVNGYFVHFFAPSGMQPLPMDIAFVLDKSGSMSGSKIQQLQTAMMNILNDIRSDDRFTIMTFDSTHSYWRSKLVPATKDNIENAKTFVGKIRAHGGTNINEALTEGLRLLSTQTDNERAPVVIFLTDGQPTSGVMNRDQILANVKRANEVNMPIFSLAFGHGADYDFVKRVAAQNYGIGRRIYEDSDASLQISGFYDEVNTVIMKNISFRYIGEVNETTVTKQNYNTYFGGSEIIVAGSTLNGSNNKISPVVMGIGNGGTIIKLTLPKKNTILEDDMKLNLTKDVDFKRITEKMWAYLTIKDLLKKRDAVTEKESKLNKDILELSLKYKFVTPLTAMVVTLPEEIQSHPVEENAGGDGMAEDVSFHLMRPVLPQKLTSAGGAVIGTRLRIQDIQRPPQTSSFMQSFIGTNQKSKQNAKKKKGGAVIGSILRIQDSQRPPQTSSFMQSFIGTNQKSKQNAKKKDGLPRSQTISRIGSSRRNRKKSKQNNKKKNAQRKPMFLVKIPGISIPLCMDLFLEAGKKYKVLEEKSTGNDLTTIIQSRIQMRKKKKSRYPSLSSISYTDSAGVQDTNSSLSISSVPNSVAMNYTFGALNVLVLQQAAGGNGYLQIQGTYSSRSPDMFGGIIGFFGDFTGRVVRHKKKRSRLIAKLKLKDGKKKIRLSALQIKDPTPVTDSCWYLNKKFVNKLRIQPRNYEKQ